MILNDTATRLIDFVINGQNYTKFSILMTGDRCINDCLANITDVPIESNYRYWSDVKSWTLPLTGSSCNSGYYSWVDSAGNTWCNKT